MGGEVREGEGSGGHALCARGATRKARSRRSSHHQASKGNQRGTTASRSRSGAALPHAPPYPPSSAPGPVISPGWPSPTDSEVKRNVPSSMNASWKPLSCPFMLVLVTAAVSESGVEEETTLRRRLRNAQAEDDVPLDSGRRRGVNEAAGSSAHYLYAEPARSRLRPRPSAPRAFASLARGRGGGAPREAQAKPLCEKRGGG